jgi:hypothetical protein
MITKTTPEEPPSTKDLIDRIAKALPAVIQADYYREMMYCRSLQENDEMLRLLRVMQFLTLLMEQVPARVVTEREKLERHFADAMSSLEKMLHSSEAHQQQLDQRLMRLPETVAAGIKPEAIAGKINESLHQQFVKSTIPETAQALGVIAEQMKKASSEFVSTASTLGNSYTGAAEEAHRAIGSIRTAISGAAEMARSAAEDLSVKFHDAYWTTLIGLVGAALLLGTFLGGVLERWIDPPKQVVIERVITPPIESAPPIRPRRK